MKKVVLIFLIILLHSFAAVKEFTLTTSKTNVALEESLIIEATLLTDKKVKATIPSFPQSEEYTIVNSDSRTQHSSSYRNINGRVTQETNYYTTYLYQLFFPKAGSITLPSLSITIDGKEHTTKGITFSVGEEKKEREISLRYIQPRKKVFLGESVPLTIEVAIKNKANIALTNAGISRLMTAIEEKIKPKGKANLLIETIKPTNRIINGITYDIFHLPYTIATLDTGTILLNNLFLPYVEQVSRNRYYNDNISRNLKMPNLHYTIKELPSAPDNFSGIVGKVALDARINKKAIPAGEGVTLTVRATGFFHDKALEKLVLPKLENIDHFAPEKSGVTDTTTRGLRSTITFNYMLLPQVEGDITIPPLEVVWFNPKTETYQTTKTQSFPLKVTKGKREADTATKRYLSKSTITKVGSDIGYIKTKKPTVGEEKALYPKKFFALLLSAPWLATLLMILYKVMSKLSPKNVTAEKKRKAFPKALKELQAIERGKSDLSPITVLERYFSEKLSLSSASLRRDELEEALTQENISETTIHKLVTYLDSVEMSRYAGKADSNTLAKEAITVLRTIEKEVA